MWYFSVKTVLFSVGYCAAKSIKTFNRVSACVCVCIVLLQKNSVEF